MRSVWLGREIVVAGLPPLIQYKEKMFTFEIEEEDLKLIVYKLYTV